MISVRYKIWDPLRHAVHYQTIIALGSYRLEWGEIQQQARYEVDRQVKVEVGMETRDQAAEEFLK